MYATKASHELSEPPASARSLRDALARGEPLAEDARVAAATFLAILEALPNSAFILDGTGRVMVTNAWGRSELEAGVLDVRSCLERQVGAAHLTVHPLPPGANGETRTLVLRSDPVVALEARIARVTALWGLTRYQAEVLGRLVHGQANKTIATTRGCALRTVEVHVTCILKKSGAHSRSELIARFWKMR